ncbi:MAG: zinc-ribbon domain-containing protein [Rhodospirillales bacterium]|nr:zinc-ribbon domain-containing protein [Rhodospirillales bacterium]MCB9973581.1 zinc-ribbon domain-containing protein [Rhodospirillales bacterium]MCB9979615.1 zinc-ribbon domain-containing protein [Rhodospirillales bacterium]
MIVTCPSCLSKFKLSADALGEEGRTVRCGDCRHQWFQTPEEDDNDALESDLEEGLEEDGFAVDLSDSQEEEDESSDSEAYPSLEESERPAATVYVSATAHLSEQKSAEDLMAARWGYRAAAVVFVLLCAGGVAFKSSISETWPSTQAVYAFFGLGGSTGPAKEDIAFERFTAISDDAHTLRLKGMVYNLTPEDIVLPALVVEVKNAEGLTANDIVVPLDEMVLEKEATHEFSQEVTSAPPLSAPEASTLLLRVATPLERQKEPLAPHTEEPQIQAQDHDPHSTPAAAAH